MAKKKKGLTVNQLIKELKKTKKLAPFYYIYGEDLFAREELLDAIISRMNPDLKDFNFHSVTAGEVTGEQIYNLAQQLPMMDDYTLIIVKEAQLLTASDWELLQGYIANPSPTTCLTFIVPDKEAKLDKRTTVGKLLAPYFVNCKKTWDNKIPQWIINRASYHKLSLEAYVPERLAEMLGSDLWALNSALERLSLYLGGQGVVTLSLLEEVIVEHRSYNIFELSDKIAQRNLQGALKLLRGLLDDGVTPLSLLSLTARAFRILLQARVDIDGGAPLSSVEKYIPNLPPFIRNKRVAQFTQQVRLFSLAELRKAIQLIQETDISLKSTSGLSVELVMERLIIELCQLKIPSEF